MVRDKSFSHYDSKEALQQQGRAVIGGPRQTDRLETLARSKLRTILRARQTQVSIQTLRCPSPLSYTSVCSCIWASLTYYPRIHLALQGDSSMVGKSSYGWNSGFRRSLNEPNYAVIKPPPIQLSDSR